MYCKAYLIDLYRTEYEKEENNLWVHHFRKTNFMTSVVTGSQICVVVVLFMIGSGVCLHMAHCLVVDELIVVITPARHLA